MKSTKQTKREASPALAAARAKKLLEETAGAASAASDSMTYAIRWKKGEFGGLLSDETTRKIEVYRFPSYAEAMKQAGKWAEEFPDTEYKVDRVAPKRSLSPWYDETSHVLYSALEELSYAPALDLIAAHLKDAERRGFEKGVREASSYCAGFSGGPRTYGYDDLAKKILRPLKRDDSAQGKVR